MSSDARRILKDALKRSSFDGAYYICGEDEFQKEDAMKRLVAAVLDPAVRDFNLDVRRAQELDSRSLDLLLSSMPMMAELRVIVIRDAGELRKDMRKAVERYLQAPSADVILLLVESADGKKDKELVGMTTVLEFELMSADDVQRWIARYASAELKTEITPGAVELLQSVAGSDLRQLVGELEKLSSFTNGRRIMEEAVTAVVGVRRGETMSDLLDAVARRDVKQALMLIDHVLTQPKTTGVLIVMLLAAQTVALAWGRAKLDEGLPPTRLQGEYFDLLKQSSPYIGRPWGTAAATWALAAGSWERQSLQRALSALLSADAALKETRFSSEEQVLTTLILAMCAGDEHRIAA